MGLSKKIALSTLFLVLCTGLFAQSSLRKANKQYGLKSYEKAIKYYEKFLRRKPNNTVALDRVADSYRQINQLQKSADWYAKAVKGGRVEPHTYLHYGKVLKALDRCDDAKKYFSLYAGKDKTTATQYLKSCDFAAKNKNNPSSVEINNEFINTSGDDYAAIPFGDRVVFASTRTDLLRSSDKKVKSDFTGGYPNQLFITEKDGSGFLRTPAFLHSDLKEQFNQAPLAYSPDGKWVAYTANNFIEGTRQLPDNGLELGLFIAAVEGEADFSEAEAFPFNGKNFSTGYPAWGEDSNTLYFASDRPNGFGGYDLYVSKRTGTSWSPPQNLGSIVNSKGNEISPFYDGTSLFFASDWHDGFGGYDIFRAEKSGKRYTNIYHTGTGVNSNADDLYYSYDVKNDIGYITSNREGGKGGYDLYRIKRVTANLVVSVTDEAGKPIKGATIDFTDCGEGVFLTDANGLYSFQVQPGLDCKPLVRMTGYRTTSFNLSSKQTNVSGTKKIVLKKGIGTTTNNTGVVINNNPTTTAPSSSTATTFPTTGGEFLGFQGSVTNKKTSVGLPSVTVTAKRNSDGMLMKSETDNFGNYVIGLNPNTSYTITYSKPDFFIENRTITTGATNDSSILGTTNLQSTSDGYVGTTNYPTTTPTNTYPPTTPSAPTTETTTYPSTTTNTNISAGYAVQVAALSANNPADLSVYSSLADLGTVYYTTVGNINKIRVGLFTTKAEAQRVAKTIKTRGYNGAFTVTEGDVAINQAATTTPTQPKPQPTVMPTPKGQYVVRLAAYSNPKKYFDPQKVADIGIISEQYKGQFTIKLLTGYRTLKDAQRALVKAKNRGFNDAYIAKDINGELIKVK